MAAAAVHTTGINWESVAAIAAAVGAIMTVVIWIFNRRDRRQADLSAELRREFTEAIDHLSEVLVARLETKETVSGLAVRLARLEGALGVQQGTSQ